MNIALKMTNDKFNDKTYTEKDLIKSAKAFENIGETVKNIPKELKFHRVK